MYCLAIETNSTEGTSDDNWGPSSSSVIWPSASAIDGSHKEYRDGGNERRNQRLGYFTGKIMIMCRFVTSTCLLVFAWARPARLEYNIIYLFYMIFQMTRPCCDMVRGRLAHSTSESRHYLITTRNIEGAACTHRAAMTEIKVCVPVTLFTLSWHIPAIEKDFSMVTDGEIDHGHV